MKLLIAAPTTGAVKTLEIEDDILRKANLSDYRMGNEIDGQIFGEAFTGYRFRISGGQDKEGFPMKQGVMTAARVRLLLVPGTLGFQKWRARTGERKRRSVRGCILGNDLAAINLVVVKKGPKDIEGLTDVSLPRRLGPKRANKIRKLFGLTNQAVTKYVVRRKVPEKDRSEKGTKNIRSYGKAPKIQRLIVPAILRRRAAKLEDKKARLQASSEERKNYISLILANRRDQRLRKQSAATSRTKRTLKKQGAEIREARRKAFEKSKKTAPKKDKPQAPAAKPAAKAPAAKKTK
jgi:small subunit ribosomal protein S6e